MKDKITKKRVKVDYLLVIRLSDNLEEFCRWQKEHTRKLSFNRLAYAFCKHKKIDVEGIYSECIRRGFLTYDDWLNETIRIAKTPWLFDD